MKKYELTNEVIKYNGINLYRIKAIMDFGNVKKGEIGGYIEKESNLSHSGDAWVSGNAKVYGDAEVSGNAEVSGDAKVYVNAKVFGNAWVYGDSWVSENAKVSGDAWVYGYAKVSGDAEVFGNAEVSGNAKVYGDAKVYENAKVSGNAIKKYYTQKSVSAKDDDHIDYPQQDKEDKLVIASIKIGKNITVIELFKTLGSYDEKDAVEIKDDKIIISKFTF